MVMFTKFRRRVQKKYEILSPTWCYLYSASNILCSFVKLSIASTVLQRVSFAQEQT